MNDPILFIRENTSVFLVGYKRVSLGQAASDTASVQLNAVALTFFFAPFRARPTFLTFGRPSAKMDPMPANNKGVGRKKIGLYTYGRKLASIHIWRFVWIRMLSDSG